MKIDIQHLAKLASLRVSEEETLCLEEQMSKIAEMASNLPELGDLQISMQPMHLREDVVLDSYDQNELLKNAPQTENGCFVVPKVIE